MMKCPVCTVAIDSPVAACPRCKADLSLLSHFMSDVRTLLEKLNGLSRLSLTLLDTQVSDLTPLQRLPALTQLNLDLFGSRLVR